MTTPSVNEVNTKIEQIRKDVHLNPKRLFYFGKFVHDLSVFDGKVIASIACGATHYMVLTANNLLYSVGSNSMGQLAIATNENEICEDARIPIRVTIPEEFIHDAYNERIVQISTKGWHNLVLLNSGRVFVNGSNKYGQLGLDKPRTINVRVLTPIPLHEEDPSIKIDLISAGVNHSVIATRDGDVFSCGWGQHGQTGHNKKADLAKFKRIEFFTTLPPNKRRIRELSSGGEHSMILTVDGVVYIMGHFERTDFLTPTPITSFDDSDNFIVQIASGDFFGMVLTSKNNIYSFGENERGQCGIGSSIRFAASPTRVIFYENDEQAPKQIPTIRKIIAGSSHAFCICGAQDEESVYAWGRGESDRLGIFDYGLNHYTPVEVQCLRGMKVKQISASGMYTLLCNSEFVEDKFLKYLFHNLKQLLDTKSHDQHYGCSEDATPKFADVIFHFVH